VAPADESPLTGLKGEERIVTAGQPGVIRMLRLLSPFSLAAAVRDVGKVAFGMRELIVELTRREVTASHAGHGLGGLWVYIHPLVTMAVYLFVLGFVLGAKITQTSSFPGDYPSYIVIGLISWLPVQASLVRSTGALIGNASLVKQVVFPIEVLPIASVTAAMWPFWPALVLCIVYKMLVGGGIGWMTLMLPVAILLQIALCIGLSFILSALTCFMRDIREFVILFCLLAMYVNPAIYLPEWVPRAFAPLLYLNPFIYLTWNYQDALFFNGIYHPWSWVVMFLMAVISLTGGYRLFQKLHPYFGNVI
jgi:lipopolysaccharide transport system permease protein